MTEWAPAVVERRRGESRQAGKQAGRQAYCSTTVGTIKCHVLHANSTQLDIVWLNWSATDWLADCVFVGLSVFSLCLSIPLSVCLFVLHTFRRH